MGRIKRKAPQSLARSATRTEIQPVSQPVSLQEADASLILEYTRNIRALFKRARFTIKYGEEWEDLSWLTEDVFKEEIDTFLKFVDAGLLEYVQGVFNDSRVHVLELNLKTREMEMGEEIVPRLHDEYYKTRVSDLYGYRYFNANLSCE